MSKKTKFETPEERLLHFRGWIAAMQCDLTVRWLLDDRGRYVFELGGKAVTRGLFWKQAYSFLSGYSYGIKYAPNDRRPSVRVVSLSRR